MLDIVLFFLTSPPVNLPISPSTNQVRSVAMSNIDGFTPNHLLQQMYETKVVDEDVDVEFNDEELESIAGNLVAQGKSFKSDILYDGKEIVNLDRFLAIIADNPHNHDGAIQYIKNQFQNHGYSISDLAAKEIWQQLRAPAPVQIKRERGGFTINLQTGGLRYVDR